MHHHGEHVEFSAGEFVALNAVGELHGNICRDEALALVHLPNGVGEFGGGGVF